MSVFLRNTHPRQIVYLPLVPGWCRVLRPAVTTCVPERLLHTPVVRQLLVRKLVDVVDGAAWDADTRQCRASRSDIARAIAAAEQREFEALLARRPEPRLRRPYRRQDKRLRKRRDDQWTAEELMLLHGVGSMATWPRRSPPSWGRARLR